jgi:hypothetical protein
MTKKAARQLPEGYYMKMAGVVVVVLVLCVLGVGSYVYYSKCGGFNSCNNPVCQHDCYENGKRVR